MPKRAFMKLEIQVLMSALVLLLAVANAGCSDGSAPSCAAIAERAVSRSLDGERHDRLPDHVRDSLHENRGTLEKRVVDRCEKRRWSKRVRRCKYNATTNAEAAACEDPLRRSR